MKLKCSTSPSAAKLRIVALWIVPSRHEVVMELMIDFSLSKLMGFSFWNICSLTAEGWRYNLEFSKDVETSHSAHWKSMNWEPPLKSTVRLQWIGNLILEAESIWGGWTCTTVNCRHWDLTFHRKTASLILWVGKFLRELNFSRIKLNLLRDLQETTQIYCHYAIRHILLILEIPPNWWIAPSVPVPHV